MRRPPQKYVPNNISSFAHRMRAIQNKITAHLSCCAFRFSEFDSASVLCALCSVLLTRVLSFLLSVFSLNCMGLVFCHMF